MYRRKARRFTIVAAGFVIGAAHGVFGQTSEPLPDLGEVSIYGGGAFGGVGNHPAFGAATGLGITKYAIGLIDSSFSPLGSRTLTRNPHTTRRSQLYDFNFSVHVQIPLEQRWTPYLLLGSAFLYNTYQTETAGPQGMLLRAGVSDAKFGFETGGGVRYYVTGEWGVRAEYRYTISTNNFSRVFCGVFYQFSGPWPFVARSNRTRLPEFYSKK